MKKILIAFLFILTAIPAAFSADEYAVLCISEDTTESICDPTDKKYKVIKGTIVEANTNYKNKISTVTITFTPDDPTEQLVSRTAGPSFAFQIEDGVPGKITFVAKGYTPQTVDASYFNESGKYIQLTPEDGTGSGKPTILISRGVIDAATITAKASNKTAETEKPATPAPTAKPTDTRTSNTRGAKAATKQTAQPATPKQEPKTEPHVVLNSVTGYIYDENGEPLIGANITPIGIAPDGQNASAADKNGHFDIANFPKDTDAKVSYIGYKTLTFSANELGKDMKIYMELDDTKLLASTVKICTSEQLPDHASSGTWFPEYTAPDGSTSQEAYCKIKTCTDGYQRSNDQKKCEPCPCGTEWTSTPDDTGTQCIRWIKNPECTSETDPKKPAHAGKAFKNCDGDTVYCKVEDCSVDWLKKSDDSKRCVVNCQSSKVHDELNALYTTEVTNAPALPQNLKNIKITDYCKATACDVSKYDLSNDICVSKEGKDCDPNVENAKGGKYVKARNGDILCEPICNGENYRVKLDGGKYSCVLKTDRENDACTTKELNSMNVPHAKHGMVKEWDKNTGEVKSCKIDACDNGWLPNAAGNGCYEICNPEITNKLKADGAFDVRVSDDGKTCVPNSCKCEYTLTDDNKCVAWAASGYTECKPKSEGAINGTPDCDGGKEVCYITTCDEPKYTLEGTAGTANAKCVSNVGKDCNDVVALPEKATAGKQREIGGQMKCVATACETGYNLRPDGSACVPKMVLPLDKYQDKIADLKNNADAMHEKENSWQNRLIGAAGIGATGVGGSMVGAALSERAADAAAESAMREYVGTFSCDYGNDQLIDGGTVNVELPGGNDLMELYADYTTRATDLKVRKDALGMRAGIESEIVIPSADTGLYEYSPDGVASGSYASIARAILYADGPDADMWAAQKQATADKLKTGAIVAGVGAVGSLAANIAVNHNNPNKVKEIKQTYDRMRIPFNDLQRRNDSRPLPTCSDIDKNANGTLGNCVCYNQPTKYWFNAEETPACQECKGDLVVNQTRSGCECPTGTQPDTQDSTKCIKVDENKCNYTGDIVVSASDGTCNCMTNADKNGTVCTCPYGSTDGKCNPAPKPEEKPDTPPQTPEGSTIATVKLQADKYFARGSYALNNDAKQDLQQFIQDAQSAANDAVPPIDLKTADDYCVIIVGKTDHQQFSAAAQKQGKNNTWLSKERANTIKTELEKAGFTNIKTYGIADKDCSNPSRGEVPECRVVVAKLIAGSCDANLQNNEALTALQTAIEFATSQDGIWAVYDQFTGKSQ